MQEPVFDKIVDEINGVLGVLLSSVDALCFAQRWVDRSDEGQSNSNTQAASSVATVAPVVIDQVSKLQLGSMQSVIAQFQTNQIVHINLAPIVLTIVGTRDLDVDTLTSSELHERLQKGFQPLREALK